MAGILCTKFTCKMSAVHNQCCFDCVEQPECIKACMNNPIECKMAEPNSLAAFLDSLKPLLKKSKGDGGGDV